MKKLILFLIVMILSSVNCYAFDMTISTEVDGAMGSTYDNPRYEPDIQLNIGQTFGMYRIYVNAERTKEDSLFPNSDKNYRVGIENNYFSWIKFETGIARYKSSGFIFGKATVSYDTNERK